MLLIAGLLLLLPLLRFGVLLIGQEAEGATNTAPATEIAWAFQYESLHKGKVNAIHVIFSANGTATALKMALWTDSAGKPGTSLAEGEITGGTGVCTTGAHEVTFGEVQLEPSTKYWLIIMATGGSLKIKEGSTTAMRKSTTKHTKISEVTSGQWTAEEVRGPVSLWATGTEDAGEAAVLLGMVV